MRRLIDRGGRERGAVAVFVAIAMVVLMGFAALAIDLGSAYSDRQQLQNGADAGALAIAQSCQSGSCFDSAGQASTLLKADKYVKANKLDGQATGAPVADWVGGTVTVEASSTHTNWFAGVIGFPTTALTARASAEWGYQSGGAVLPLTFSWCEFQMATGGWDDKGKPINPDVITIAPMKDKACDNPAHNATPGGFGWLAGASSRCVAKVNAGNWVMADTGADLPSACKDYNWKSLQGATVLIPIFEDSRGTGSNAEYQVRGLAAFTFTGYCFSNSVNWNMTACPSKKRIEGHFSSYTDISGAYAIDPSATHFGAGMARLTA